MRTFKLKDDYPQDKIYLHEIGFVKKGKLLKTTNRLFLALFDAKQIHCFEEINAPATKG